MGFFKDLKSDLSQAVNELSDDAAKAVGAAPETAKGLNMDNMTAFDDNIMVDTLPEEDILAQNIAAKQEEMTGESIDEIANALKRELEQELELEASVQQEAPVQQMPVQPERPAAPVYNTAPTAPTPASTARRESNPLSNETAIITTGLKINGDIESSGSIELLGTVDGNVTCRGKLIVSGTINGNSQASDFFADKATITGDVSCNGPAKIGSGSVIKGNLAATSAVIAGAIKGDIDVHGPVIVDTTAIVMGNIKSKAVQINNGAVIEGYCSQCYSDNSPKKFFKED